MRRTFALCLLLVSLMVFVALKLDAAVELGSLKLGTQIQT